MGFTGFAILPMLRRMGQTQASSRLGVELVSTSDIARERGLHVRTVHRMVERKELVPFVIGPGERGAYMFRRQDVEAAFAGRRTAAYGWKSTMAAPSASIAFSVARSAAALRCASVSGVDVLGEILSSLSLSRSISSRNP